MYDVVLAVPSIPRSIGYEGHMHAHETICFQNCAESGEAWRPFAHVRKPGGTLLTLLRERHTCITSSADECELKAVTGANSTKIQK